MKVSEAVCKRDWHVRSYLFFNVWKFRTLCAMAFRLKLSFNMVVQNGLLWEIIICHFQQGEQELSSVHAEIFTVCRKLFWQLGPQLKNLQSCSHKHLQAKQMTCTMRNRSQCQSRNSPHNLLSEASWGSTLLHAIWADTQRLSPCCCRPYGILTDHMLQLHTTHKTAAKTGRETTGLVWFVAGFAFKNVPFYTFVLFYYFMK